MTVLTKGDRLQLILTYYILWKIKTAPRVTRRVVRYTTPRATPFSKSDLAGASIADLGTKDHDLLDGLLDDDHTQYELAAATRGDVNVGANSLIFTDSILYRYNATTLAITNLAKTALRNMRLNLLSVGTGIVTIAPLNAYINTSASATNHWYFYSWDTALRLCMDLANGMVAIPRCGDIIPKSTGTYDLGTTALRFDRSYVGEMYGSELRCNIHGNVDDTDTAWQLDPANSILAIVDATDVFYIYPTGLDMEAGMITNLRLTTMGDGGTTDYVDVEEDGDVTYVGGAGVPYGCISVIENANNTVIPAGGGPANKAQFVHFDTDNAEHNTDADHTNDHIVIQKAGAYLITCSCHLESIAAGGGDNAYVEIWKNNGATFIDGLHAHHLLAGGGADEECLSMIGIATGLAVNDTIELWLINVDSGDDLLCTHASLSVVQIGG